MYQTNFSEENVDLNSKHAPKFFDPRYLIRKSASPRAARRFSGVASSPRLSHSFTDHLSKK